MPPCNVKEPQSLCNWELSNAGVEASSRWENKNYLQREKLKTQNLLYKNRLLQKSILNHVLTSTMSIPKFEYNV